jgi:hypothetical protein
MICPALAVWAGDKLKLPHAPALPQLAVQFTPRLPVSFVTFAASVTWDPAVTVAGGAVDIATRIGAVVTIVAVADADIAGFVVDFAVMLTVPPGGTVEGLR